MLLVNQPRRFFENEVFHACVGEFLTGLAEQHHQYHPLDLLDIDVRGLERQQAVNEDLSLWRREDADLLEVGDVAATR